MKIGNFTLSPEAVDALGFGEQLKQAEQKKSQQQMSHTASSSQTELKKTAAGGTLAGDIRANIQEGLVTPLETLADPSKTTEQKLEAGMSFGGVGGIFTKASASGVAQKLIDKADELLQAGKSHEEIFKETGLQQGLVDKQWRSWIDDKDAMVKADKFKEDEFKPGQFLLQDKGTVADYLEHSELFNRFPWVKDIKIEADPEEFMTASYNPKTNTIKLGAMSRLDGLEPMEQATSKILHEVQHAIQVKHGLTGGSSWQAFLPDNFFKDSAEAGRNFNKLYNQLKLKHPEAFNGNGLKQQYEGDPKFAEFVQSRDKALSLANMEQKARNLYRRVGGEMEARAVQEMFKNALKGKKVGPQLPAGWYGLQDKEYVHSNLLLDFLDMKASEAIDTPISSYEIR